MKLTMTNMKREEAVEALKQNVLKLASSEEFQKYLAFSASMPRFSLRNTLMIWWQMPHATVVGGAKTFWVKKMGRRVKYEEFCNRPIHIWAPIIKKERRADGSERDALVGFRLVKVYDVSQTEGGTPLPEMPRPKLLEGVEDGGIFEALRAHVEQSGLAFKLEADPVTPDANGSYSWLEKLIRVRPDLSLLQRAKTLAHEVAHWKLHSDDEGRALPREIKETEAEAASFLALAHFGIDAGSYSFGYLAHWTSGNLKMIDQSLKRIEKAADEIVKVIESRIGAAETADERDGAELVGAEA